MSDSIDPEFAVVYSDELTVKEPLKTHTFAAIFIVLNAALGAAMLNFPKAFQLAGGLLPAICIELAIVFIVFGSLVILGICSDLRGAKVYQDVVRTMCGNAIAFTTEVIIVIYSFATCVTYLIIAADQGKSMTHLILGEAFEKNPLLWRRLVTAALGIFIVLPMCISRNISYLSIPGMLSFLGNTYVVIIVIIRYFYKGHEEVPIPEHQDVTIYQLLNVIPTISFGYQCHVSAIPVYSSMKNRNMYHWALVSAIAVFLCFSVYTSIGIFGYLSFFETVQSDILVTYPDDDILITIARTMVMFSVMASYPVIHFCGRAALFSVMVNFFEKYSPTNALCYYSTTILWFATTLGLALFVDRLEPVIKPIGSFAALFVFGYPGLCLLMYALNHGGGKSYLLAILSVFYIGFGVFCFGNGIASEFL